MKKFSDSSINVLYYISFFFNYQQHNIYDKCSVLFNSVDYEGRKSIENLIYLLRLVLKQAKDQVNAALVVKNRKKNNRRRAKAERKTSCAKAYFDRSVDLLVDIVRKDRETAYLDLDNCTILSKALIKWLYYG